jgi:hypothetical protein
VPGAVQPTSMSVLRFGRVERKPELDALRGLFLVWMTLTHLPTHLSDLVNQPLGFVSSAEGFVYLSAFLIARLYIRQAAEEESAMRARLWKRALRIYGYHVIMLTLAFTVAGAFAAHTHRAALANLLDFYLAHPATAIVGSLLLLYCPPLLDILPMYVTFMFITPTILSVAARRGWNWILVSSSIIWLLAQFGLRTWMHNLAVHATGLHIPLQETGAFNLFAWQSVWVLGLWIGASSAHGDLAFRRLPGFAYPISAAICLFFLGVRHHWLGGKLAEQTLALSLDKWQIGPLRMLNLVAFACVIYWLRKALTRLVLVEPFVTLGKASLEVFCAHVFFVFVGLALLYGQRSELHGIHAALFVGVTFAALILVAAREGNRKHAQRSAKTKAEAPSA